LRFRSQHADAPHAAGLLCVRRKWPRRRASEPAMNWRPSLDNLVGSGQQRFRYGEAESLGGLEDDDEFELGRLLDRVGDDFSHRVLIEAAQGWFLADRRDQKTGVKVAYYDQHVLNQQRAYQIVCLMVGADGDIANETKLPEERRDRLQQRRVLMGYGAQAASALRRPAENRN
jgi:hypothetical protein